MRRTRIQSSEIRSRGIGLAAAALLAGLLVASASSALPYAITGGEIILTASSGGSFLTDPVEIPVDGEHVDLDLAPGSEQVVSMLLTGDGPIAVALTPPLGGYTGLRVDTLALAGGPGALVEIGPAPPDVEYFAVIEDLVLDVSFALVDPTLPDDPGAVMIPLGTGTAQLFVALSGDELTLTGFAIADFVHPDFAGGPITIKADFDVTAVLVPEPASAIVFAIGLLPIAGAVRRKHKSRGADRSR